MGTRDIIRNIAAGFYVRKIVEVGKPLEVAGQQGTLVAITATHAVLEADGKETLLPNGQFFDHVARQ